MVRDMMVACVEKRFRVFRALHRVQWLSDNGTDVIDKSFPCVFTLD
jgi:hypothetical protein